MATSKKGLLLAALILCVACGQRPTFQAVPSALFLTPANTELASPGRTSESASPSQTVLPSEIKLNATGEVPDPTTVTPQNTPRPSLAPDAWTSLPIVPSVSPRVKEIYQHGLELGNNPKAFSKVGDCGSTPAWFLGDFDRGPRYYNLGAYQYLEAVIQEFQGSFARTSLAAKSGFNASSVFAPLWSDRKQCESNETPLGCEYRLHRPAFAFITLGTNDAWHLDTFEPQMRRIIEFSIQNGVIPILSTKADNEEGDGSINATIARLANEYDIPLWNYWLAMQPLPDHGLQEDAAHITWGPNLFNDPQAMEKGWPVRNLTALQVLDVVWRAANNMSHTKFNLGVTPAIKTPTPNPSPVSGEGKRT